MNSGSTDKLNDAAFEQVNEGSYNEQIKPVSGKVKFIMSVALLAVSAIYVCLLFRFI